jgi:hypothetical protein
VPDTRVDATVRMLEAAARQAGYLVGGDLRVSEAHAAELVGVDAKTMENWRCRNGGGPAWYRLGARVTYRVDDLAMFIESRRFPC